MYIQVMIIDPDLDKAKALKYALQSGAVRAYSTTSVTEGLKHLTRFRYQPVILDVCAAKIQALLRRNARTEIPIDAPPILTVDNKLLIDPQRRKVVLMDVEITLPRKQFELLYLLAGNAGCVFTREQLYKKVWGEMLVTILTLNGNNLVEAA